MPKFLGGYSIVMYVEKEFFMTQDTLVQNDDVLDRADDIMDKAIETAGELLSTKPDVAEVVLKQLLKCDPEHLGGLQLLGLCKHRMGQNAEAVEIFQAALELDPTSADNHNNIGLAYSGLDNTERAIEYMSKAIELKPEQFLFMNNIALQYRNRGDRATAVEKLERALEIKEIPQMYLNLGGIYGELHELDKAKKCFSRAVELDPNYSAAHVDLAMVNHLQGNFLEGFQEYEWRFEYYPQMCHYIRSYDQARRWDGEASLEGKKFLIYCEQGLGDAIQFVRYTRELKKLGAYVILHCAPTLDDVLSRCESVDETVQRDIVYNKGDEFPSYDYQCAAMSLPYLLKIEKPTGEPYLEPATNDFNKYLAEEYGDSFNIGIIWAGSPAHPHDKRRSIPLSNFRALHETEGVKLFSLQLDVGKRKYGSVAYPTESPERLSAFQAERDIIDYCEGCDDMNLVDLCPMIQSFEDTATIFAGLDLVICCDTAAAHLAGAMGRPCWIALPYNPDWRWKKEGDTTEWYDSVRLFRQEERDDWTGVFEKIKVALDETLLQNK
jgi:tetratricopeptide (TPR) repeat protein